MGAAEAPSSAGRQAAGGRSSQRRGRAALDGGSEAIRQGSKGPGTPVRRVAGSPARSPPRGRRATAAGCRGGGGTGPCCLGHSGQRAMPAGGSGGGSVGRRWRI